MSRVLVHFLGLKRHSKNENYQTPISLSQVNREMSANAKRATPLNPTNWPALPTSSIIQEKNMPQNEQLEPRTPTYLEDVGDCLPVRTFSPYFQGLCHGLINSKCITGVIQNGELCIRHSEISHYTAPGWDPPLPN
jgi:hypothetical protein